MSTDAQLAANRANAQHSTGPSSPDGRAASSQNARTHGLRAPYLTHFSPDEERAFRAWCDDLRACLLPGSALEDELFQQMTIHGWKARQGEALFGACYNLGIMDKINGHFDEQGALTPENRLKFDIPGATPAEALAASQADPRLAAGIYMLGLRRRPSILTLQRMITSHENAFHRRRKELERLIAQRRALQAVESKCATETAQTNPISSPGVPSGPGRNSPCPCGSGLKFKRCCLGKPRPAPAAA